jgi:hypothetical protein
LDVKDGMCRNQPQEVQFAGKRYFVDMNVYGLRQASKPSDLKANILKFEILKSTMAKLRTWLSTQLYMCQLSEIHFILEV